MLSYVDAVLTDLRGFVGMLHKNVHRPRVSSLFVQYVSCFYKLVMPISKSGL